MKRALCTLAVLLALYVGAYSALVDVNHTFRGEGPPYPLAPVYKIGGDVSKSVFTPVHMVDRMLRPDHWQIPVEDVPDVPDWIQER